MAPAPKNGALTMCCLVPNSITSGKPLPRPTLWEALAELWRGGRWYDADTRPLHNTQET